MFTIIVCSIRPAEAQALKENIERTIGVPFEFLAYDNRNTGKGICQVYNECASKARYDNLCFIHEDVEFLTYDWGQIIGQKLSEKDCGVIGFVGAQMKSKKLSGWLSTHKYGIRANYIQNKDGSEIQYSTNPDNEDFSQVVTLDGLCLFSSKKTWNSIKFDSETLTKFHCYDVDYSLACHIAGLKNYVSNTVLVKHMSCGSYDEVWFKENEAFHQKWSQDLPAYTTEVPYLRRLYLEYRTEKEWGEIMYEIGLYNGLTFSFIVKYFMLHPLNARSYRYLAKYLKSVFKKAD